VAKTTIPAKLENLKSMLQFIRDGAEQQGFSKKEVSKIQVAAEEALVNVISYAYPDDGGDIEIRCNARGVEGLVIEIIDWGTPFDPLLLPEPDTEAPPEEREVGGLGIHIMRNIMDEVSYEREGDRNILTLTKYIN
jgi:anti-sigma regulatory factor (Ser/Thr protein kinase)